MTINWEAFTPWSSLAGGLLIGLAAAMLIIFNGRVAGISGILGSLLEHATWKANNKWAFPVFFIAGLLGAPLLYSLFTNLPKMEMTSDLITIVVAGLLVGFGTRLASGCTSGHGVCGLSRLSLRSFSATMTFMATGVLTVALIRHIF